MKFLVFALTGMGNEIIRKASQCKTAGDVLVVTRKEEGPFPYYNCCHLDEECKRYGIEYRYIHELGNSGGIAEFARRYAPDVITAATFHRIFSREVLDSAKREAVNFHPSLLPHFRGPNPTNWTIIFGETQTGVTLHRMTTQIDAGDVLLQEKTLLTGMTDGALRKRLFQLAGEMFATFMVLMNQETIRVTPMAKGGSSQPGIRSPQGIQLLNSGRFNRDNIIRGLTPYPGPGILEKEQYEL